MRRSPSFVTAAAAAAAAVITLASPAAAGAATSPAPPTAVLLTPAQAAQAGFPKIIDAPAVITRTGLAGCPRATGEAFEDQTGTSGLVSQMYFCDSTSAVNSLMKHIRTSGKSYPQLVPPSGLSTSAVEREARGSFGIFWTKGNAVEVTALDTAIGAGSGSTTTTAPATLSPIQQAILRVAARQQNARYRTVSFAAVSAAQAAANATAGKAGCPTSTAAKLHKPKWSKAPSLSIDPQKAYVATVRTDAGTFAISLDAAHSPQTVNNFVFLAEHNFFNCVTFHRVIPGFVDQTGDPTATGGGGPGYTIPDELPAAAATPATQYPLGSVAMANTGAAHSGGSQWFIVAGPQGESLPARYAVIGQVSSGMPVVTKINTDGSPTGVPPTVIHRVLRITVGSS
jgi:cyclophilin family peptidyl-prolyl cis-trans isomerase